MTDTIKITSLSQMGTTIPGPTLVPVVDMSGVPTTKKATIANIANAILSQAGNGYAYAAKANLANTAGSAGSVSNASQPNITSVGTLTSLTVSGTTNLGAVGNVIISGGANGQLLTTNGNGELSWSTVGTSVAGANTQVQFNDAGDFGGSANFVFDKTTNNLSLSGNIIAQAGVYSNVISSIGSSNLELWINSPSGFSFVFTNGGALQIPGGHVLETDGDGEFELKSGNGIVISSDIANTNQHFSFRTDGVFHAPSNVELEGTRLSIGPGAANVSLVAPTVVINANSNVYVQAALTNENANGSADWVAYGTDGDDMGGWTDFGFTGYNFNDANYTITGPGDGYLFAHAYANGAGGGNLVLATGDHGTHNDIVFATNGFAVENEFGRISDANNSLELTRTGATITFPDSTEQSTAFTGNIAAANVTGLGNIATVNLTGSTSNVLYGNGAFAAVPATAPAGSNGEIQFNISGAFASTGNLTFVDGISGGTLEIGPPGAMQLDGNGTIVASSLESTSDVYLYAANGIVDLRATGNIVLKSDNANYEWVFGDDGNLILAGGSSVIQSIANSSLDPTLPNVSTMTLTPDQNYTSQVLVLDPTAPGHIHLRAYAFSDIDEPAANIFLGGEDTSFEVTSGSNNEARIHSGGNTWTFGNDGVLTLPGEGVISSNDDTVIIQSYDTANAISKGIRLGTNGSLYFEDDSNAWLTIDNVSNNAVLTAAANSYVRIASNNGSENWYFESDGNLTLSGNTVAINFANGTPAFGNIVSVNLDGNVSNALIGDGTFGAVAIKETGNWTLASGVNTVSINVPLNGTYAIWVNGNIPNGIITYTATAVVTNTNVPVLGDQYAWYYETGNALVFTSIPDQFVGTQGAISNATPYLGNTANVFTFGITNNSGSSQEVNWGYTKL